MNYGKGRARSRVVECCVEVSGLMGGLIGVLSVGGYNMYGEGMRCVREGNVNMR